MLMSSYSVAILEGNDVFGPKFNLGFGGRRTFCDTEYADLGKPNALVLFRFLALDVGSMLPLPYFHHTIQCYKLCEL